MMKPQGRVGDISFCPADAHGCPSCPHPVQGPATQGSPTVIVNNQPALRVGDPGTHAACCGGNSWTAAQGSGTVLIDGKPAFRQSDSSRHCGGQGQLIQGSQNVWVGG
ncbi:MAG: PAAR domain-containing protein [Myxococcota bacterium]